MAAAMDAAPPAGHDASYYRALIREHRSELDDVLFRYGATNPRLFGSVARGDATATSDIDVLVDLMPDAGNELIRISGIIEEFRRVLRVNVDVVTRSLLNDSVAATLEQDLVAL